MRLTLAVIALCLAPTLVMAQGTTTVRGHIRKDGTYVPPHTRTAPNNTRTDNWSSAPNVNPYTGKQGTVDPYAPKPPKKNCSGFGC